MNLELLNFIINNIILRDKINSYKLLQILEIYKLYNKKNIEIDLSNIEINILHLNKILMIYNNLDIKQITNIYGNDYQNIPCIFDNLNYFNNLKIINFEHNRTIMDLNINKLYNLEEIILPKNKLITNKGLKNLNKLFKIDLSNNTNIDNNALIDKIDLEYLKLVHNKKINDEAFINIRKLKSLHLGYNNNRKLNLDFIKNNENLKEVILFRKKKISDEIIELLKNMDNVICSQLHIFN